MKAYPHDPRRRLLLSASAGVLLSVTIPQRVGAVDEVEITMSGTPTGSHVWFRPRGLLIQPGQAVRWINEEAGNVHTVTAYHPDNGRPLRIPGDAKSWDSDYLMPAASFMMTFEKPGIYDYFCIPHEHAGMVGRIVVGQVDASAPPYASTDAILPAAALAGFPTVASILKDTMVE